MFTEIFNRTDAIVLTVVLFFSMLLISWLGNRVRKLVDQRLPVSDEDGIKGLEGGMLGLLAFVLAITFGISANKYERNREVIIAEANAIGTAVLRADLYPDTIRQAFRIDFEQYVEKRIRFYTTGADVQTIIQAKKEAAVISDRIWKLAAETSKLPGMLIPSTQMIPSLNEMIDITTSIDAVQKSRVPDIILLTLGILALTSSFLAGFEAKCMVLRDWLVMSGFCLLTCLVIYVILDLGRPRRGLIRSEIGEQAMIELRQMFHP